MTTPPRITLDPNLNPIIAFDDLPHELKAPAQEAHALNRRYYALLGNRRARVVFPSNASLPVYCEEEPAPKKRPAKRKNHVAQDETSLNLPKGGSTPQN